MNLQIILMSRFALPLILQIIDAGSFPLIFPLEIVVGKYSLFYNLMSCSPSIKGVLFVYALS